MKKILLKSVLVLAMATSLIACSKDDGTTSPSSIVGKWEATTDFSKVTINGQVLQSLTDTFSVGELYVDFLSNGTMISSSIDTSAMNDTSTYVVNGSAVTIISLDKRDTSIFSISNLTSSTLRLGESQTQIQNGSTIVSEYSINFKKK
ncbi:MAG: hypothetical protein K9I48_07345 [Sphingobacteriales bacterium]|nr:hypothetical protein [Sphingobacteriales bacterium]